MVPPADTVYSVTTIQITSLLDFKILGTYIRTHTDTKTNHMILLACACVCIKWVCIISVLSHLKCLNDKRQHHYRSWVGMGGGERVGGTGACVPKA